MLCGLIRPAFLAARGTLDRWGRGLPVPDLGDGLAVPLAVRRGHRLRAVSRCARSSVRAKCKNRRGSHD